MSVDPLTQSFPWYTPYQFAGNKPIAAIDLDGFEEKMEYKMKVEYKPVFQEGITLQEGVNNSIHNLLAIGSNGVVVGPQNVIIGVWNFGVGIVDGEYNNSTIIHDRLGMENDHWRKSTATEYFLEPFSDPTNYEGFPLLFLGPEMVSRNFTKSVVVNEVKAATRSVSSKGILKEVDGFIKVYDDAGNNAGHGWLNGDELNLVIDIRKTNMKGSIVFDDIFSYINTNWDKIGSIRGRWRSGPLDSNFKSFLENAKSMTDKEAALNTFKGKMAQRKGFTNASVTRIKDSQGNTTGIDVIFSN